MTTFSAFAFLVMCVRLSTANHGDARTSSDVEGTCPIRPNYLKGSLVECRKTLFCGKTVGDVELTTAQEALDFSEVARIIEGDLDLSSVDLSGLTFKNLLRVTGLILGINSRLTHLSFPKLLIAGGVFLPNNHVLEEVNFSSLNNVGGMVYFRGSPVLEEVNFSSLETVGGEIRMHTIPLLKKLLFPKLLFAGSANLYNNPVLEEVNFSSLETVGGEIYMHCDALKELSFPNLLDAGSIDLSLASQVKFVDFPGRYCSAPLHPGHKWAVCHCGTHKHIGAVDPIDRFNTISYLHTN